MNSNKTMHFLSIILGIYHMVIYANSLYIVYAQIYTKITVCLPYKNYQFFKELVFLGNAFIVLT